jgi:hypothetical protein
MEDMEAKITGFTASMPERVKILEHSVKSILPQVDRMRVVLNNFRKIPQFCYHEKITVIPHDNKLEDGSRFIFIENALPGYSLVFDDDIIYPSDYVKVLKSKLEKYDMVCPMGKIMKPFPLTSYYDGVLKSYKTFEEVDQDYEVDVPGACGIMWDNRKVKVNQDIIKSPNSDVCLAVFCRQNNIKPVVIAHKADWMKNIFYQVKAPSIYGKYRKNDKVITDFLNASWT